MATAARASSLTGSTTALWADPTSRATFVQGAEVLIRNRSAVAIYLGSSEVTTSTGFQLDPGELISFRQARGEVVYVISATATAADTIHVLRTKRAEKGLDS